MTTVLIYLSGSERDSESDRGRERKRESVCESLGGKLDTVAERRRKKVHEC